MNTFTSFCIGACIFMCFVGMAGTLVNVIGCFPATVNTGENLHGTGGSIFNNLTQNISSTSDDPFHFDNLWLIGTGIAAGGSIAVAMSILTGTTTFIGIWLFGSVFWSGWINLLTILNTNSYMTGNAAGVIILGMLTLGMMVMFVGAIIGMFGGSQGMK